MLPPFSSLPSYTQTPPSTPVTPIRPFRVGPATPSDLTPTPRTTQFPTSPATPTSLFGPSGLVLPPIESLFVEADLQASETSPSEIRESERPGAPQVDHAETAEFLGGGEAEENATVESEQPLPELVPCGWLDCSWAAEPFDKVSWGDHMVRHFREARGNEKVKDDRGTCMWRRVDFECTRRPSRTCWRSHYRTHDRRFYIRCHFCNQTKVISLKRLREHLAGCPKAQRAASGNGGQNVDGRDDGATPNE